jgi:hypothetical protein
MPRSSRPTDGAGRTHPFPAGRGRFLLRQPREEAAANAQIKAIRAELAGRLAEASYNAATMNLTALGLQ